MTRAISAMCLAFMVLGGRAQAQSSDTARLHVTVVDPTNAAIPGAVVTLLGLDEPPPG